MLSYDLAYHFNILKDIKGYALERGGEPVDDLDLTVVTHNIREISRVPRLRLEDWR